MSIIQVSEKIIRKNYPTLEDYLQTNLTHYESDLFYNDGQVYKIFHKMFRLDRENYMWILDKNTFNNVINIESLLYQGDKLIGCTTKYYENLNSLKEIIIKNKLELSEINEIYAILINLQEQLLKYNLCYIDSNLSNIYMHNQQILVGDIDGVYYNADKRIIKFSYINFFKLYLSLLLNDNIFKYENHIQQEIINKLFNIDLNNIDKILKSMTQIQRDEINEKYLNLKKIAKLSI